MFKKNKYNAKKTIIGGIKFDSKLEAESYLELIKHDFDLTLQPKIILQEKFKSKRVATVGAITYKPDFLVKVKSEDGIVEKHFIDIKGMETAIFKLKRKLFLKKLESEKYSYFYTIKTLKGLKAFINNLN